jgi:cytochrome c oxidase assembly factor CtaG
VTDSDLLALVIVVLGLMALRSAQRPFVLLAGVGIAAATVLPPLDDWGQRSLVGHMVQHLIHTDVVPPLAFFGAPLLTRPFRILAAPASLFVSLAIIWGIHFSPLFEASLEQASLHALVQVLFLSAGALMWAPVFDPDRLNHIARLGYVFLAMPLTGFLGFVLYSNRFPLYAHYVHLCGSGALADQQAGGELMWIGGSAIMFVGFMVVAFEYARYESRIAAENTAGQS